MNTYINEPLVQPMPMFYRFMGGFNFIGSTQALNKLTNAPRHWRGNKVKVDYTPRTLVMEFGEFICPHTNTYTDAIEHYDHYMDAVTGMPQPTHYEPVEVCEQCGAYYSQWSGEWNES